jgi:ABC-2 type transport system ATP-binding protein
MSEAATIEAQPPEAAALDAEAMISVRALTKTFKSLTAVDHISFDVAPGEIFAFLGPNGAGKSTTIKILTTLLRPTSGEIRVNGFDPTRVPNQVRRSFGIVFQDPSVDDQLTAMENMELHGVLYKVPRKIRKQRIEELLKSVDLWDRRNDVLSKYSGGMRRRLEIARGLLHHPTILFLDEPTLGLDPQTRNQMWSYVNEMNKSQGTTIFFTTHYLDEADRHAQRLAIIDYGKIAAMGTPAEVKASQNAETLEEAFLKITGHTIREEDASATDRMRSRVRGFAGRGR